MALMLFYFKYANSQCLPNGILFNTQSQIDSFQINFPGCTEILGHVTILGENITNVDGLSTVKRIGGSLDLSYNDSLTDLSGFDSLKYCKILYLVGSNSLTNINGFNSLDSIELIEIGYLTSLETINGFANLIYAGDNIFITECPSLISISGFNSLPYVWGLYVHDNYLLTEISGFNSLTSSHEFHFANNYQISDMTGFSNLETVADLVLFDTKLTDLFWLHNLKTINSYFILKHNSLLESLSGIDSVNFSSANIYISNNYLLSMCAIENLCILLDTLPENILVSDNATGCNSKEEIQEACSTGIFEFSQPTEIIIFPNPASISLENIIKVEYDNLNKYKNTELRFIDVLGRQVYKERIYNTLDRNIVDISQWSTGIYYVLLLSDSKIIAMDKFMIK